MIGHIDSTLCDSFPCYVLYKQKSLPFGQDVAWLDVKVFNFYLATAFSPHAYDMYVTALVCGVLFL